MYRDPNRVSCVRSVLSEIELGLKYRQETKRQREDLENRKECQVNKKKKGKKKKKKKGPSMLEQLENPNLPCVKLDDLFKALNAGSEKFADPFRVIKQKEKRQRKKANKKRKEEYASGKRKRKIVDRDKLTHRQHINLLAKPRKVPCNCPEKPPNLCQTNKKKKCMCFDLEGPPYLSPRLKKLAEPNKRLVYANWCSYKHVLDPDSIVRMENILVAGKGQNLEGKEMECYFKEREKKAKKKQKKPSKVEKEKEKAHKEWQKNEINILADLIVYDMAKHRLEAENNRHIQLTNIMMDTLRYKGYKIAQISRNTKNLQKRCTLQIYDHISVWADKVYKRAEVIQLEVNIKRYEKMLAKYEEDQERQQEEELQSRIRSMYSKLSVFDELSYAEDREVIESVIKYLERAEDAKLNAKVHSELLAGVTYGQLLDKMLGLRDASTDTALKRRPVYSLNQEMMKWSIIKNRPQQLSKAAKRAVEAVSKCLRKYFKVKSSANERGHHHRQHRDNDEEPSESSADKQRTLETRSEPDAMDLSEIPTYRDPNEDMDATENMTSDVENEEIYDDSMFVGSVDHITRGEYDD